MVANSKNNACISMFIIKDGSSWRQIDHLPRLSLFLIHLGASWNLHQKGSPIWMTSLLELLCGPGAIMRHALTDVCAFIRGAHIQIKHVGGRGCGTRLWWFGGEKNLLVCTILMLHANDICRSYSRLVGRARSLCNDSLCGCRRISCRLLVLGCVQRRCHIVLFSEYVVEVQCWWWLLAGWCVKVKDQKAGNQLLWSRSGDWFIPTPHINRKWRLTVTLAAKDVPPGNSWSPCRNPRFYDKNGIGSQRMNGHSIGGSRNITYNSNDSKIACRR